MRYTASPSTRIWVDSLDRFVTFIPRTRFPAREVPQAAFLMPMPPTKLPVDWTKGNALSFPYDGNDQYGDCMYAAACHGDNTWTGNVGAEYVFDTKAIIKSYLKLSGGDNGLDEGMILGEWKKGLASTSSACIFDSVDVDPNNANQMQAATYLFGGVQFQLSVPDKWINSFKTGATWDAPASPDPKNGHGIHFNGVDSHGHYKLQTWGTYGWITPAGVAACDPSAFVVASLRWFNSAGYAPNGLHYTQLAPLWVQLGGSPWPASPFPAPAPTPTPTPPEPTPIPPSPDYPMSGSYQFGIYKVDWTATVNDPIPNPPVTGR